MHNEIWLREISKWKLEAGDEDSVKYFYRRPDISSIEDGELCYVLGRKGTGKTAVAEHIRGLADYNVFVRSLSFKNFPFNDLYKLEDKAYTSPSQYTTIWKYVIYSAICEMMSQNQSIDSEVSRDLSKYFSLDVERALAQTITKISEGSGGFTLFGSGADASLKSIVVENNTSWQQRTLILEKLVEQYIDASTYYILFDELDEDYKDVLQRDVSQNYLNLLIGLFKAIQDIRRRIGKSRLVRPVAFLRTDIYDLLADNDKNKWRDNALELSWSDGQLRNMLAFRLSRAKNADSNMIPFDTLIAELFTATHTRAGGARRQKHVFEYILSYTLMRPRDIISYIRESVKITLDLSKSKISTNSFADANKLYSSRLRQELTDEIQGAIPEVDQIFEAISKVRKQVFDKAEFERSYENLVASGNINTPLSFTQVCRVLFHFSVLGNQPSQHSARIFRYIYPNANLNEKEKLTIHKGLLQSLQIS